MSGDGRLWPVVGLSGPELWRTERLVALAVTAALAVVVLAAEVVVSSRLGHTTGLLVVGGGLVAVVLVQALTGAEDGTEDGQDEMAEVVGEEPLMVTDQGCSCPAGEPLICAWRVMDEHPHTVGRVRVGGRLLTVDWPTDIDDETQREDYVLLFDGDTQVAEVADVLPGVVLDSVEKALALAVAFVACFPEEVRAGE